MERRRVVEARDHLERAERALAGLTGETARWAREAIRGLAEVLALQEASGDGPPAPCIRCGKHPAALGYLCGGCSDEAQPDRISALAGRRNAAHLASLTRPSPTPSQVPWGLP